jgi:hypothetical protein
VNIFNLVMHHPGHHPATGMRRLHLDVGHTGYYRRTPGYGYFKAVRVSSADYFVLLEHGDRTIQVKVRPQYFRIIVQPVAMSSGLGMNPLNELVTGYVPHFEHRI